MVEVDRRRVLETFAGADHDFGVDVANGRGHRRHHHRVEKLNRLRPAENQYRPELVWRAELVRPDLPTVYSFGQEPSDSQSANSSGGWARYPRSRRWSISRPRFLFK